MLFSLPELSSGTVEFSRAGGFGGRTSAVEVVGNYAYFNQGQDLIVRDLAERRDLLRLPLPSTPQRITFSGAHLFIACADAGLVIVDVTDRGAPRIASTLPLPGFARDLLVQDPFVYAVAGNRAVYLTDVSDRSRPAVVRSVVEDYYVEDVAIAGSTLFVSDGINGIHVYDISTPTSPAAIGSIQNVRQNGQLVASYPYLYVSQLDGALEIYNISDPRSPARLSRLQTPGRAADLDISGSTLFLSNRSRLVIVDIANASSPTLLSQSEIAAIDAKVVRSVIYAAADFTGLLTIDISNPRDPALTGRRHTLGVPRALSVSGTRAVAADFHNGMLSLDISDPKLIRSSSALALPSPPLDAAFTGTHCLVACGEDGLQSVSMTTPLRKVATLARSCQAVSTSGSFALLGRGSAGIDVLDISNPSRPRRLSSLALSGWIDRVLLRNRTGYAGNGSDLYVIDLRDPRRPVLAGRMTAAGTFGLAAQTRYLFAAGLGSLKVFDLDDPVDPANLSSIETKPPQYVTSMSVSGGRAFLAARFSGIWLYDVSDRTRPALAASWVPGGDISFVHWAKPYLFAGDGRDGGLDVLSVTGGPAFEE